LKASPNLRAIGAASAISAALWGAPGLASADDFAVAASPPRFELTARPGSRLREVLEIDNAAPSAASYLMKTAEWSLDVNGGAVFSDALKPDSCRPWVAIERGDITVPGHGSYRFRFEVTPPAAAPRGECRFAILIEGKGQPVKTKAGLAFPVSGRIGIIVYLAVGDVRPQLEITGGGVGAVGGEPRPVLRVRNSGDAHGRLEGFLHGVDAKGVKIDFTPATLPILAGETRVIPLNIEQPDKTRPIHIAWPITIHGKMFWAGGSTTFSQAFVP